MTFEIDLDSFCDDIFYKMEEIQDGTSGHTIEFTGNSKEECIVKIFNRLGGFVESQLREKEDD